MTSFSHPAPISCLWVLPVGKGSAKIFSGPRFPDKV